MGEWVVEFVRILFGQLGALTTVMMLWTGYIAYLHWDERRAHQETRKVTDAATEKRLELYQQNIKALLEIKILLESVLARNRAER